MSSPASDPQAGPMEGVKVVELAYWVAGPAAAEVLAEWGADVIKIEPPGVGDPCRILKDMVASDLPFNPIFEMDNRSKRLVVLDLRSEEGLKVGLELLDQADVFVSNLRMDALERLGLGPDTLMGRNERLIYAHVSGFGLEGEDRGRPAYDVGAYWSRGGMADILSEGRGEPLQQRGAFGDHPTGMNAAGGISAALFQRERTGKGQLVTTSLLRTAVWQLAWDYSMMTRLGMTPGYGSRDVQIPQVNCYKCSDGKWFWLLGLEPDRHWKPLLQAIGRLDWVDEPRFATFAARTENQAEIIKECEKVFATKTRDEWTAIFDSIPDMWWAPINNLDDALADPQLHAAGCFTEVPDSGTTTLFPNTPIDFDGQSPKPRWMAGELGSHTDEVLAELGRSADQIAALRKSGAVS